MNLKLSRITYFNNNDKMLLLPDQQIAINLMKVSNSFAKQN